MTFSVYVFDAQLHQGSLSLVNGDEEVNVDLMRQFYGFMLKVSHGLICPISVTIFEVKVTVILTI